MGFYPVYFTYLSLLSFVYYSHTLQHPHQKTKSHNNLECFFRKYKSYSNPLQTRCLSYLNMNLPVSGPSNEISAQPIVPKYLLIDKSTFSSDIKQAIILFGKLAENYYPYTPEQEPKKGEFYSLFMKGRPSPLHKYFNAQDPPPPKTPKWHKLFPNRDLDEKISRSEFRDALSKLNFKWPLYRNETVVQSSFYNKLVDQNIQSIKLKRSQTNVKENEDFLKLIKDFITTLASLPNSTMSFSSDITPVVRLRNRSESRAIVHQLFNNETLTMRICNAFINSLFHDPSKEDFTKFEFARGLRSLSGEFSNGLVFFDQFFRIIMEQLKTLPEETTTSTVTSKAESHTNDLSHDLEKKNTSRKWHFKSFLRKFGF